MKNVAISARLGALFLESMALTCFLCGTAGAARTDPVLKYRTYFASGTCGNQDAVAIRAFDRAGNAFFLTVNPHTLNVSVSPARSCNLETSSWTSLYGKYAGTPYIRALIKAKSRASVLQDAGIVHGFPQERGVTLTVDLCPSRKGLDRALFNGLVAALSKRERPVPVSLSITGRFLRAHPDDIRWLRSRIESGDLAVTWVNHSYNHRYDPKKPLARNFLLSPGTDVRGEVLQLETALLEQEFSPSVFFRFPGLVSDGRLVSDIIAYGLVPLGADAWLAKGESASDGSIVLIHGNGNEPLGVKDLFKLLKKEEPEVFKGRWRLYDLGETVRESVASASPDTALSAPNDLYFLRRDTLRAVPQKAETQVREHPFWIFPDASLDAEATDALHR